MFWVLVMLAPGLVSAQFNVTIGDGLVSRLLYNTTLYFDPFSFQFAVYTVTVTNLTCTNIITEGISGRVVSLSEPLRPNRNGLLVVNATAYGMDLNCHALWSYPGLLGDSGDMNLTLSDGSALDLVLALSKVVPIDPTLSNSPTSSPSPSQTISHSTSTSTTVSVSGTISPATVASSDSMTTSPSPSVTVSQTASLSLNGGLAVVLRERLVQEISDQQLILMTAEDADSTSAPQFALTLRNCSMYAVITKLRTSSPTLNGLRPQIIQALGPVIPVIVCEKVQQIITGEVEPLLNTLSEEVWAGLNRLRSGAPEKIFNEEGFFYSFLGASLLLFLIFVIMTGLPSLVELFNDFRNRKYADLGDDTPLVIPETELLLTSLEKPVSNWKPLLIDPRLSWYSRYLILLRSRCPK